MRTVYTRRKEIIFEKLSQIEFERLFEKPGLYWTLMKNKEAEVESLNHQKYGFSNNFKGEVERAIKRNMVVMSRKYKIGQKNNHSTQSECFIYDPSKNMYLKKIEKTFRVSREVSEEVFNKCLQIIKEQKENDCINEWTTPSEDYYDNLENWTFSINQKGELV